MLTAILPINEAQPREPGMQDSIASAAAMGAFFVSVFHVDAWSTAIMTQPTLALLVCDVEA